MRVGPTCQESNLTSECLSVCEDDCQKALVQDLCMTKAQAPKPSETCVCTASTSPSGVMKVWNSEGRSFKKRDDVNGYSQKLQGFPEQRACPTKHDQELKTAAVIANKSKTAPVPPAPSSLKSPNGPEACSRDPLRECSAEHVRAESWRPLQPSAKPFGGFHAGGSASHAAGAIGRDQDPLRESNEGPHIRGRLRQRAGSWITWQPAPR